MSVGFRLRRERERLEMTQAEFAEKTGIHRVSQSNYERDSSDPSSEYWQKADALGVDVYYVLMGKRQK